MSTRNNYCSGRTKQGNIATFSYIEILMGARQLHNLQVDIDQHYSYSYVYVANIFQQFP